MGKSLILITTYHYPFYSDDEVYMELDADDINNYWPDDPTREEASWKNGRKGEMIFEGKLIIRKFEGDNVTIFIAPCVDNKYASFPQLYVKSLYATISRGDSIAYLVLHDKDLEEELKEESSKILTTHKFGSANVCVYQHVQYCDINTKVKEFADRKIDVNGFFEFIKCEFKRK